MGIVNKGNELGLKKCNLRIFCHLCEGFLGTDTENI